MTSLGSANIVDISSLISTYKNPFQTNTKLNSSAHPCQTLHQPHTAPNISPSATLSLSISTVNPIKPFSAVKPNYSVLFVATNKSVIIFFGLDHQYTSGKNLLQIDAPMIFLMGEQFLDL